MARLNVELKDPMYEEFQRRSTAEGLCMSEVIRSLILSWLIRRRREDAQTARAAATDGEVKDGIGS